MGRRREAVDHTADTGIRVFASNVEGLFEESAEAMFDLMFADHPGLPAIWFEVEATGSTFEELLVAWLSELLYTSEAHRVGLTRFLVDDIGLTSVSGRAGGWPVDEMPLEGPPVKAVTYHGLEIHHNREWSALIIFDV